MDHASHGTRKPTSPPKKVTPKPIGEGFKSVEQIKKDILNRPRNPGKM
jgi:hypothetical protein